VGWRILGWDVVDWELWLIAALVCLMIEFLTVDFSFLMIGGGALVGACIAAGSDSLAVQVAGFAVASILFLLVVRPWAKRRFNSKGSKVGSVEVRIGQPARTLTVVDTSAGRVKIGGDVWSARTVAGSIPEGVDATVTGIDGAIALVERRI
jgi:putative membrane protein